MPQQLYYDSICGKVKPRGVAQPGSAPEWGSGGRRFKSSHPDIEIFQTSQKGRGHRVLGQELGIVRGSGECQLFGMLLSWRVFKNAVRGFSLVHDPKGSHYENLGGEWVLKLDEAKLNSLKG